MVSAMKKNQIFFAGQMDIENLANQLKEKGDLFCEDVKKILGEHKQCALCKVKKKELRDGSETF